MVSESHRASGTDIDSANSSKPSEQQSRILRCKPSKRDSQDVGLN
jgi:hypothetical protein